MSNKKKIASEGKGERKQGSPGKTQYTFHVNNTEGNKEDYSFQDNHIRTTKYRWYTFLPLALVYQFVRLANVYFLFCAILQCIPIISPLGAASGIIPLIIVLSVSLIREGIEDLARRRMDKAQNAEIIAVYRNNQWQHVKSGQLFIGEIIRMKQDETFPADLILIDSNLPEGICFIETGTLDGEKTLKLKQAPMQTVGLFNGNDQEKDVVISGDCICDQPNANLYQLNGKLSLTIKEASASNDYCIPLESKNLLLKGAKLKNTQWCIGIIIYTGKDCKLMKNAKKPRTKYSTVEGLMNRSLILVLFLQLILCIICAVLRGVLYTKNTIRNPYINFLHYSILVESIIAFFSYVLLLNTMIPISLIITLEIVKLIQGTFISVDREGYSLIRKKFIKPNSVSLNEELGLVNYIFSDKTGTLTCNKMMFKYGVIGDVCYEFIRNEGDENEGKVIREQENIVSFKRMEMYSASLPNSHHALNVSKYDGFKVRSSLEEECFIDMESSHRVIGEYWKALALCHDCSIQSKENENGKEEEYIGMSPDSIELVQTAKEQGFALTESGISSIKKLRLGPSSSGIDNNKDMIEEYEKLQLIEFTSDRKRESIIIKDKGIIKLYIKGADSIIEERLSKRTRPEILSQSRYYVNKFSAQGYRTLFIAMRILTQSEYDLFNKSLTEANLDLVNKSHRLEEVYNTIEQDLYLLGATIVEDKLQDKVPETIRDLRIAKIKIWMLTGDKMNTAYNIGLSCNLISKDLKTFHIEGIEQKKNEKMEIINNEERQGVIIHFAKEYNKFKEEQTEGTFAILVDEKALLIIHEDSEMTKIFLDIAKDAVAVICCRVSPLQKSQVVKMMKQYDKQAVTLAIGDGGNDVSMIMEAHIGIGIYGEEGMRAVQSGDYAIGEFKILRRLLLYHGRMSYIRNSEMVLYFFYKNFVFTIIQFFFGFYNNFSGQTIIDDWFITLFNLLFTSLPLGVRAVLDWDIKPDDGLIIYQMMPFLYNETRSNPIFTYANFALTLLKGTVHCAINFFFVFYIIYRHTIDSNGNYPDLWYTSVDLFTNIMFIVSIDLIIMTRYHTIFNGIIMFTFSFFCYFIFLIVVHYLPWFSTTTSMLIAFSSGLLWLDLVFVVLFTMLIDYAIAAINYTFIPTIANVLSGVVSERGTCEDRLDLPIIIQGHLQLYDEYASQVKYDVKIV